MTLTVEFAVGDPGGCPVAAASARAGESVTAVSRASPRDSGRVTEEFALPADAQVAGDDRPTDGDDGATGDDDGAAGDDDSASDTDDRTAGTDDRTAGDAALDALRIVGTTAAETIYRFERDPAAPCVCECVEAIAGPASDVRAEDGTLVVTVHAESVETVQAVVERLRDGFDGVRVRRLTNLESLADDGRVLDADGALTDRQREVLRTAHDLGYFEYPKGANAGDVADELGIARSTLAEHLAVAQGKVLDSLIDRADPTTPSAAGV